MIKKICNFLTTIPMTVISGIFLVISFILSKTQVNFPIDPAWVSVIVSGLPILYSAIRKLIHNRGISKISSALLISSATIASVFIGDIFAAGEVVFIMAIGEILEDLTTDRAKKGLDKLISSIPLEARKIINGKEESVSIENVCAGDIIRVLPGETIPVDGIIAVGETSVDQSVMTGESLPVDKLEGDEVFCGTVNRFGSIDVKAVKVGDNSSLNKLVRLVEEAENKKAPTARIADRWASLLVPAALLIAIITGIATQNVVRAVTVLVVFCPCALVLATPTAIMAAIGQATKRGVIIKSGEALEKMGKVDTVAFDKTGTLTEGKLKVSDTVVFINNMTDELLVTLTASVEAKSEHPLGRAILSHAKDVELKEVSNFKMWAGYGVSGEIGGIEILCGNENFLSQHKVELDENNTKKLNELRSQGKALVLTAINGTCIGVIALSDTLRHESAQTVTSLNEIQTDTVLLTGDNKLSAEYFSKQAGIKKVFAELLPEGKVERIKALQKSGKTVCMIGDGINDAPALKTADVGIAVGSIGSDITVDASDIALMSDGISSLPYLKRLALATVKTIRFSISLSMIINVAAVILSVIGALTPTTGALVHNGGSVFVILIAALLYDRKF